jgi:superfamily II DNA/RNA helicase
MTRRSWLAHRDVMQELMRKKVLHLGGVKTLVLDEADRMLDMGFEPAIREISARTAGDRQSLLFSATFPEPIVALAQSLLRNPERVEVQAEAAQQTAISQHFIETAHSQRGETLLRALAQTKPASCVVFCNTRRDTDDIASLLIERGYSALALHGDMEQRDREEVLLRFANRSARVLVASDVAARGLDIDDLAAVINLELPHDVEVYTHRIGRTGRAGKTGLAISLVTPAEMPRALALEDALGSPTALAARSSGSRTRQRRTATPASDDHAAHRRGKNRQAATGRHRRRSDRRRRIERTNRSARSTSSRRDPSSPSNANSPTSPCNACAPGRSKVAASAFDEWTERAALADRQARPCGRNSSAA